MDHKAWLWKKRSTEKKITETDSNDSHNGVGEEMLSNEKETTVLESSLEALNEKLSSLLSESKAKDDLLATQIEAVEEANAARQKAEAEAASLKQELQKALQHKEDSNERLTQLNAALKESVQLLASVQEEQEQRIRDAVTKTSLEFEKTQKLLEEKLAEKSIMLTDLSKSRSQAEAEFNTLMTRLDSVEKENAFLKYEFRMLEKELEVRNEEIAYNRQVAEVSRKQHSESVKKISKLEADCQRLRVLVRKRLPGPNSIVNMKNEVEIIASNRPEMRRKKSLVVKETTTSSLPNTPSKRISYLIEQLCNVEAENKNLKEIIAKKDEELHFSQIVCSQTASKLSVIEYQLEEHSKGKKSMELARCSPVTTVLSPTSSFGLSNDKFKESDGNHKSFGVQDMSLMDDFVEMEKLAIVTSDALRGTSDDSSDVKDVLPISSDPTLNGYDWLQDVLKLILDQSYSTEKSFDDLLEDIRMGLTYVKNSGDLDPTPISGYITWKSPNASPRVSSVSEVPRGVVSVVETRNRPIETTMRDELEKDQNTEFSARELEASPEKENEKSEHLIKQLEESEQMVRNLKTEVENLKDQIENQKLINEDLDTQLTVTKFKLNEVDQKLSSFEVELEDKTHCCEELEATCLELQLQLESVNNNEVQKHNVDKESKLLQTGWEITAASAKLAECQDTILNLGKQLKALASPRETTFFINKKLIQRSSLRDRMLAEDGVETDNSKSPETNGVVSSVQENKSAIVPYKNASPLTVSSEAFTGSQAIVPGKKRGGFGLLRKLLVRRKNTNTNKAIR